MRVRPELPYVVWIPILAATFVRTTFFGPGVPTTVAWTLGGLLAWTWIEYALHRWLFHWEPGHPRLRAWLRPLHREHHVAQAADRTMVHPLASLAVGALLFPVCRALAGADAGLALWGGLVAGYLSYETIHYRTHFTRPRSAVGRALRRRHLQHHFAREDRWYGVTSPLWDYVFRTHLPPRAGRGAVARPAR